MIKAFIVEDNRLRAVADLCDLCRGVCVAPAPEVSHETIQPLGRGVVVDFCFSGAPGVSSGTYMTADIAPNIAADLVPLTERISRVWTLREHPVWEAANLLRPELKHETDNLDGRRFVEFVRSDALVDAVLMLTSLVAPKRSITSLGNNEVHWICAMALRARRSPPVGSRSPILTLRPRS